MDFSCFASLMRWLELVLLLLLGFSTIATLTHLLELGLLPLLVLSWFARPIRSSALAQQWW
jgi:hypothetical protein